VEYFTDRFKVLSTKYIDNMGSKNSTPADEDEEEEESLESSSSIDNTFHSDEVNFSSMDEDELSLEILLSHARLIAESI